MVTFLKALPISPPEHNNNCLTCEEITSIIWMVDSF